VLLRDQPTSLALAIALLGPAAVAADPPGSAPQDAIVRELARFDLGARAVTVAEWRKGDTTAVFEPFDGADRGTDRWCVRTVRGEKLAGGGEWKRTAFFFDPHPPPDLRLPRGSPEELRDECVLGLMRIEAPADARGVLDRAAAERFGPGRRLPEYERLHFRGVTGMVEDVVAWSLPVLVHAVVARENGTPFIQLSNARWDLAEQFRDLDRGEVKLEEAIVDLLASVAEVRRIDDGARAAMARLLADYDYYAPQPAPSTAEIVRAFERWANAARRLPVSDRVDALLVADRAMRFIDNTLGFANREDLPQSAPPEPPASQRGAPPANGAGQAPSRIRVAGAEFAWQPLGDSWSYASSFLREALDVAPPGPARDRALLRAMESGFDFTGMCDAGEDEWKKVIDAGEPLAARTKDRRVAAVAHFLLGDAYATVVDLANPQGVEASYADASRYAELAHDARRTALKHYRAALPIDRTSTAARNAWRAAWRLEAGLQPLVQRFFCFYD
jgi:hypothetical protein